MLPLGIEGEVHYAEEVLELKGLSFHNSLGSVFFSVSEKGLSRCVTIITEGSMSMAVRCTLLKTELCSETR